MNEWVFIDLAKVRAEARKLWVTGPVTKADAALALDYEVLEGQPRFRGAVALVGAALVTGAFLGAIEGSALNARTPTGEVIVAELDQAQLQAAYARANVAQASL